MTISCFDREDETFIVLVNHEEQYSIWPHWKPVPGGWTAVEGVRGDKQTVLDYVEKTWTDMRPLSLRKWMDEQAAKEQQAGGMQPQEKEVKGTTIKTKKSKKKVAKQQSSPDSETIGAAQ